PFFPEIIPVSTNVKFDIYPLAPRGLLSDYLLLNSLKIDAVITGWWATNPAYPQPPVDFVQDFPFEMIVESLNGGISWNVISTTSPLANYQGFRVPGGVQSGVGNYVSEIIQDPRRTLAGQNHLIVASVNDNPEGIPGDGPWETKDDGATWTNIG